MKQLIIKNFHLATHYISLLFCFVFEQLRISGVWKQANKWFASRLSPGSNIFLPLYQQRVRHKKSQSVLMICAVPSKVNILPR